MFEQYCDHAPLNHKIISWWHVVSYLHLCIFILYVLLNLELRTVLNHIHVYVLLLHIWIIEIEIINASLIQSSDKYWNISYNVPNHTHVESIKNWSKMYLCEVHGKHCRGKIRSLTKAQKFLLKQLLMPSKFQQLLCNNCLHQQ